MEIQLENQLTIISIVNLKLKKKTNKQKQQQKRKRATRLQSTCKQFNHLHFAAHSTPLTHRQRHQRNEDMIQSNIERDSKRITEQINLADFTV